MGAIWSVLPQIDSATGEFTAVIMNAATPWIMPCAEPPAELFVGDVIRIGSSSTALNTDYVTVMEKVKVDFLQNGVVSGGAGVKMSLHAYDDVIGTYYIEMDAPTVENNTIGAAATGVFSTLVAGVQTSSAKWHMAHTNGVFYAYRVNLVNNWTLPTGHVDMKSQLAADLETYLLRNRHTLLRNETGSDWGESDAIEANRQAASRALARVESAQELLREAQAALAVLQGLTTPGGPAALFAGANGSALLAAAYITLGVRPSHDVIGPDYDADYAAGQITVSALQSVLADKQILYNAAASRNVADGDQRLMYYPVFKVKEWLTKLGQVQVNLDHSFKCLSYIKLVGYTVTEKRNAGFSTGHEQKTDDWIAMRIDKVPGRVISNNSHANGSFAVLHMGDEKDGSSHYHAYEPLGIATHVFDSTSSVIRNLTLHFFDREGKPAHIGRIHLWFKVCAIHG